MPYRVSITKDGLYRATLISSHGFNFFECKHWYVFARELECRLMVEKREKILETAPIEKESKSGV